MGGDLNPEEEVIQVAPVSSKGLQMIWASTSLGPTSRALEVSIAYRNVDTRDRMRLPRPAPNQPTQPTTARHTQPCHSDTQHQRSPHADGGMPQQSCRSVGHERQDAVAQACSHPRKGPPCTARPTEPRGHPSAGITLN